uniref:RNase H type-1 domain-containing protein n=1 Tax=Nelumbo nucifera TaxID=4432 RepID=A0A822XQS1_NELNU|nr:TPA_asm: hypothetical protein HUJ06_023845 [Nelumbo nucifera]
MNRKEVRGLGIQRYCHKKQCTPDEAYVAFHDRTKQVVGLAFIFEILRGKGVVWLPTPISSSNQDARNGKVAELIDFDLFSWNCSMLETSFESEKLAELKRRREEGDTNPATCIIEHSIGWSPSTAPFVKINVDGAMGNGKSRLGLVIRDHCGAFLFGRAIPTDLSDPKLSEARAVRVGLQMTLNLNFSHIWLEGDTPKVICLMLDNRLDVPWRLNTVDNYCRNLLSLLILLGLYLMLICCNEVA